MRHFGIWFSCWFVIDWTNHIYLRFELKLVFSKAEDEARRELLWTRFGFSPSAILQKWRYVAMQSRILGDTQVDNNPGDGFLSWNSGARSLFAQLQTWSFNGYSKGMAQFFLLPPFINWLEYLGNGLTSQTWPLQPRVISRFSFCGRKTPGKLIRSPQDLGLNYPATTRWCPKLKPPQLVRP